MSGLCSGKLASSWLQVGFKWLRARDWHVARTSSFKDDIPDCAPTDIFSPRFFSFSFNNGPNPVPNPVLFVTSRERLLGTEPSVFPSFGAKPLEKSWVWG